MKIAREDILEHFKAFGDVIAIRYFVEGNNGRLEIHDLILPFRFVVSRCKCTISTTVTVYSHGYLRQCSSYFWSMHSPPSPMIHVE